MNHKRKILRKMLHCSLMLWPCLMDLCSAQSFRCCKGNYKMTLCTLMDHINYLSHFPLRRCSGWEALKSNCCVPGSNLGKRREMWQIVIIRKENKWLKWISLSIVLSDAVQSGSGEMLMICLIWPLTRQRNIIPAFDPPTLSVMSPIQLRSTCPNYR